LGIRQVVVASSYGETAVAATNCCATGGGCCVTISPAGNRWVVYVGGAQADCGPWVSK
jgi:hypothetical protein